MLKGARYPVNARAIFEVSEDEIVDAIADLMHLAWVGTNDDGEGMIAEDLIERAFVHFYAERGEGDDIAQTLADDGQPERTTRPDYV